MDEKKTMGDNSINSYSLNDGLIQVTLAAKDNHLIYRPSFQHLEQTDKDILHTISGLNGKKPSNKRDFTHYVSKQYPDLPKRKYASLYTAFCYMNDKTKWINLIASDTNVTRILCPAPETPMQIWHTNAPNGAVTTIVPSRDDLNKFATFLISSSKQQIEVDKTDYLFRFKSGDLVSLTKRKNKQGEYYQIDLTKQSSTISSTIHPSKSPNIHSKTPSTISREKRLAVNASLNDIFTRDYALDLQDIKEIKAEKNIEPELEQIIEEEKEDTNTISINLKGLFSGKAKKQTKTLAEQTHYSASYHDVPPPLTPPGYTADEGYWLIKPHAYAIIVRDAQEERSYLIIEPELTLKEHIILEETHETLRDVLIYDTPREKGALFLQYHDVARIVKTFDPSISSERLDVLYYYLKRNLSGYGKIDPLMYDEYLEDISCNGHDIPVYIHHRLYGSIPTTIMFEAEDLNRYVLKLSQKADKQVSLTTPLLDASLPNGSRAQITYSDVVSTKGSSFTIRKFRADPMTPATLLSFGTYSDELLAFIWLALENKQSLIVVGGTASGKTSAMNAFSFFIPHHSKIVSLEDTREIQIPQKNWLPVQTRATNSIHERGNVDLFDLLKASLRQRPEYIIVGEVRGSEAQTLFQAMNSGHTTLSTLHAGNIEEALNRLTNEPINVPPAMFGALKLMVIQTLHYQEGKMIRRCDAIHELLLSEGDKLRWNTLYEYDPNNDAFCKKFKKSTVLTTIQYMHNWSDEELAYQLELRASFLRRLRKTGITNSHHLMYMITDLRKVAQNIV